MNYRIKIFTRSMNLELYKYSSKLIELPYPKIRLTNTTAEGYFYEILKDKQCDIAINIDEDAFVINNESLKLLIEYFIINKYVNCGMPDGGIVSIRSYNPIVTNPYFNILNLTEIRKLFNEKAIEDFSYIDNIKILRHKFPQEILKTEYDFQLEKFEVFYPFFFWLSHNFKTLYLTAEEHNDRYSSRLLNQNKKPFLIHSWYSRHFKKDEFHTQRIHSIINECYQLSNKSIIKINLIDKIHQKLDQFKTYNKELSIKIRVKRKIKQIFRNAVKRHT